MAAPAPVSAPVAPRPSAALYVGDLLPNVTEADLWNHFSQIGQILNVRLCRDVATKRSLGYGYVNFVNPQDAERAIDTKANMPIAGRPCRIMWSQRDPSLRRSGVGNLFVKNLAETIDVQKLQNYFSAYGNILSCKVALDDKDRSKGFGFVHFETPESAQSAIAEMNGKVIEGQAIFVAKHIPKRQRGSPSDSKWTNVFIKNLPAEWDEEKIKTEFGKFGTITSIFMKKHTFSKSEPGTEPVERVFAFVNYDNHENALNAVESMNNQKIGDVTIFCGRAQTKAERSSALSREHSAIQAERAAAQSNLYVKNLDDGVTKEVLEKYFSQFGTVASAKVAVDATGTSKGFGYVSFTTPEAAQKAQEDANSHVIAGFTKPLYVAFFQPKAQRNAHIAQNVARAQRMPFVNPAYPYPFFPQNARSFPPQRFPLNGPMTTQPARGGPRNPQQPRMPRNPQQAAPQTRPVQPVAQAATRPSQVPSKEALKAMDNQAAVTSIGDYLFNSMQKDYPQRTGKITGMLLSMFDGDLNGLIDLVHNSAALTEQIKEANQILDEQEKGAAVTAQ